MSLMMLNAEIFIYILPKPFSDTNRTRALLGRNLAVTDAQENPMYLT